MASSSSYLPLPDLTLISLQITGKHRLSLSRTSLSRKCPRYNHVHRIRIRAVKEDSVVVEDKRRSEAELIREVNDLELNGNGAVKRSSSGSNSNGSISSVNGYTNGSLMKYVNGNGAAAVEVATEVEKQELEKLGKEDERKKNVEEIGKEDAWFKKSGQQVEVLYL